MGCPTTPLLNTLGHVLPGTIFILVSLNWCNSFYRRYFLCLRESKLSPENARQFKSTISFPLSFAPNIPLEPILGLTASCAGLLMQVYEINLKCYALHNLLYVPYGMTAAVEIMRWYRFPIPDNTPYLVGLLGPIGNIVILYTHSIHTNPFKRLSHQNLILILTFAGLFLIAEMRNRHSALATLGRIVSGLFMGVWYITLGLANNKMWHIFDDLGDDDESLIVLQLIFVSQLYFLVSLVFSIGVIKYYSIRSMRLEEVSAALDLERLDDGLSEYKSMHKIEYIDESCQSLLYSDMSKDGP